MKIGVFSSKAYDRDYLTKANHAFGFELDFLESKLTHETIALAEPFDVVSVFVNDILDAKVLDNLKQFGIRHVALRCAGFNNLDLNHAREIGLTVSRIPAYSPEAVAEHTLALMMSLNRKIHKAYNRVKENNFNLEGLLGFNFCGRTIGVVGTGKIGAAVSNIMLGLGCKVVAYDPFPSQSLMDKGVKYLSFSALLQTSDVVTLHCPLTDKNQHLINAQAIDMMKNGVMLINTSRGGLVDTKAVIQGLKNRQIGFLGLDVYEMESEFFFQDLSAEIIQDDILVRLSGFPNVVITGHQGFFTHEAMEQIANTTLANINDVVNNTTNPDTFL